MNLYEATLRVAHDSAYAELTRGRDLRLEMWCNDHCDLIRATGDDLAATRERIDALVGVRDSHRSDETLLLITDDCLRTHQEPLIETYLGDHGCLWWPPQQYEHGQLLVQVLALSEERLTALYQHLIDNFPVTVESKHRRPHDVLDDTVGRVGSSTSELTDRQAEALLAAYEHGFYEIPREHTSAEIAETLDLGRRTFEEHLRRAEGKVVDGAVTELGGSG